MRRPRPLIVVLVLLAPLLLVAGVWLGGHPERLPGFARDAFVDDDTVVVAEALDLVQDDYVRRVSDDDLANAAIKGMVGSLGDQFSSYFTPEEYARYREVTDAEFSGVGLSVIGVDEGLRVTRVYNGSPAERAGIKPRRPHRRGGRQEHARVPEETAVARVKGPAGSRVRLRVERDGKAFERVVTRATVTIPVVESRMRARRRREGRLRRAGAVQLRRARRGPRGRAQAARGRGQGAGVRPARQPRRPRPRGAARRERVHQGGHDRQHQGPRRAAADAEGDRRPGRRRPADGGARRPRDRVVRGDRDGRAAGPQTRRGGRNPDVREGRLPGGRAAVQRRRARHHRGPVLHPQRPEPRRRAEARPGRAARDRGGGRPEDAVRRGAAGGPEALARS